MKHHYVPEFLQKPWTNINGDKKLESFQLDLNSLVSTRRAPKFTGYGDDLWALDRSGVAGISKQDIEEIFFKGIDQKATLIRDHMLIQDKALSSQQAYEWVIFLISLKVRQPDLVSAIKLDAKMTLSDELLKDPLDYSNIKGSDEPDDLLSWVQSNMPGIIENFGVTLISQLNLDEKLIEAVYNFHWKLYDFSNMKNELILSDHPCVYSHGLNDKNCVIALPISPSKLFLAYHPEISDKIPSLDIKWLLEWVNDRSIYQASKYIYARNCRPHRFIENRFKRRYKARMNSN